MSIRSYRIIEITSEEASFNLWHDRKLMNFLDGEAQFSSYLSDGVGLADVPVRILKRAVRMSVKFNLSNETVERLKRDIASAKSNGDETVTYYCF
jgi:hypothetical protein